jgi:hypothetical protein
MESAAQLARLRYAVAMAKRWKTLVDGSWIAITVEGEDIPNNTTHKCTYTKNGLQHTVASDAAWDSGAIPAAAITGEWTVRPPEPPATPTAILV